jgi:cysteine desulfurase
MTGRHPALVEGPVYLDYNATTPVDPAVVEAMLPYLSVHFGNPSSGHPYAGAPRAALAAARDEVRALVGAPSGQIVFTGSGSEANNLAIRGTVLTAGADPPHVITQATEHPAVLATCAALHRLHGVEVTRLPVDTHGLVDPAELDAAFTPRTVLVSIMAANNETGVLQPVDELARVTHAHGALLHTDAAQAVGKVPVDVSELGADLLTIVGHKMYAPKGIAALYLRPGLALEPVVYGGGQEGGLRAGTENVALAVALGAAAVLAARELAGGGQQRLRALRDRLHARLTDTLPDRVLLNGHPDRRLPNTLNVSIPGLSGDDLLAATPGVAASTGSACHSGDRRPSPVLTAMGHPDARSLAAVRLSLGRWTTAGDIERAGDLLTASARHPGRGRPGHPGSGRNGVPAWYD